MESNGKGPISSPFALSLDSRNSRKSGKPNKNKNKKGAAVGTIVG